VRKSLAIWWWARFYLTCLLRVGVALHQPPLAFSLTLWWRSSNSSAIVVQALQITLWCLNMGCGKLMPQYGFDMKKKNLMEDERKCKAQRVHTHRNPKRYISPVSLLLWWKWWSCTALFGLYTCMFWYDSFKKMKCILFMTPIVCLRMWSVREWVRQ